MTGDEKDLICPRCGFKLLWNGRAMACIACSYLSTSPKSEKRLPAARSRRKEKKGDQPSS